MIITAAFSDSTHMSGWRSSTSECNPLCQYAVGVTTSQDVAPTSSSDPDLSRLLRTSGNVGVLSEFLTQNYIKLSECWQIFGACLLAIFVQSVIRMLMVGWSGDYRELSLQPMTGMLNPDWLRSSWAICSYSQWSMLTLDWSDGLSSLRHNWGQTNQGKMY